MVKAHHQPLYFGVEAGGTKFNAIAATGPGAILAEQRVATTDPKTCLASVRAILADFEIQYGKPDGFGVATFGPVDLNTSSKTYGRIVSTPKPGWSGVDIVGGLTPAGCAAVLDTDVSAAALAEASWGAAQGAGTVAYITVGTGIGVGFVKNGTALRGGWHPELGHIRVPRHPEDRDYAGHCPYHGDCLEGLACGPAIIERYGSSLSTLAPDHVAISVVSYYVAQLCLAIALSLCPERIVIGGGVTKAKPLLAHIQSDFDALLGDYRYGPLAKLKGADIIAAPGLGDRAGPMGAIALAMQAAGHGATMDPIQAAVGE